MTLSDWADIATVVSSLGLVGILLSLRYDKVDAWRHAHDLYMRTATPAMRGAVLKHYDDGLAFSYWPKDEQQAGKSLCGILEEVCFFQRAVGRAFWPTFGHPVGKAYLLLRAAIAEDRQRDGREGKWPKWHCFERIGKKALGKFPEIERNYKSKVPEAL